MCPVGTLLARVVHVQVEVVGDVALVQGELPDLQHGGAPTLNVNMIVLIVKKERGQKKGEMGESVDWIGKFLARPLHLSEKLCEKKYIQYSEMLVSLLFCLFKTS